MLRAHWDHEASPPVVARRGYIRQSTPVYPRLCYAAHGWLHVASRVCVCIHATSRLHQIPITYSYAAKCILHPQDQATRAPTPHNHRRGQEIHASLCPPVSEQAFEVPAQFVALLHVTMKHLKAIGDLRMDGRREEGGGEMNA